MSARHLSWLAGAVLVGALLSCADALFLAPGGSTIGLQANPTFVPADGGVSVITAVVFEPAGTPVADGTVVLFFTNLGFIEPQGKTRNGIAKVNFTSDSRSGTALITATSGGAGLPSSGASPSASPTPPTSTGGTGLTQQTTTVTVGNANVTTVCCLRADPPRITTSNSTHVFARVTGASGNGIANVPVFFEVDDADKPTEFFDIQGPVFTNNNGEAENVMRTKRTVQGSVQVTASAPGATAMIKSTALTIPVL